MLNKFSDYGAAVAGKLWISSVLLHAKTTRSCKVTVYSWLYRMCVGMILLTGYSGKRLRNTEYEFRFLFN